jgi:hypothetical protein
MLIGQLHKNVHKIIPNHYCSFTRTFFLGSSQGVEGETQSPIYGACGHASTLKIENFKKAKLSALRCWN